MFVYIIHVKDNLGERRWPRYYIGVCGKSGLCLFTLYMLRTIWGKGDGRGISGFAVNRGAVNRGFTVIVFFSLFI